MADVKDIKFSIIMPTYNRGWCINKAIDSVLLQTNQNFELLIIDDGSSDDTEKNIKNSYAKNISNKQIRFIKSSHKGVCKARNKGLKLAKNEWIAYLDSDNVMRPLFLDSFAKAIVENPDVMWFYGQIENINDRNVIGRPFVEKDLKEGNYIDLGAVVHNKELVKKLGGFDVKLKRLVDWELFLRFSKKNKPYFVEKIVLDYNDSCDINRISNQESIENALAYIAKKHLVLLSNQNILNKGITMKLCVLKIARLFHFINKKKYNEKRQIELVKQSPLFDAKWYLSQNPDVKSKKIGAAKHYVKYGWKEGRNPSPKFDGNVYLEENYDVRCVDVCPLVHYIISGAREGRSFVGINIPSSNSGLQHMRISLSQKIKDILSYPERIKTEYDRLNEELKTLERK